MSDRITDPERYGMAASSGILRQRADRSMPADTVAAWIDDLRAAFGAETIDAAIRGAVRDGRPTFYAEERGQSIGTPATLADPERCVSVGVEQLAKGSRQ